MAFPCTPKFNVGWQRRWGESRGSANLFSTYVCHCRRNIFPTRTTLRTNFNVGCLRKGQFFFRCSWGSQRVFFQQRLSEMLFEGAAKLNIQDQFCRQLLESISQVEMNTYRKQHWVKYCEVGKSKRETPTPPVSKLAVSSFSTCEILSSEGAKTENNKGNNPQH